MCMYCYVCSSSYALYFCRQIVGRQTVGRQYRMRQSCVFMRHRLALALIGSLLLHTFMLGLLPSMGGGKRADPPLSPPSRLQVRMLPPGAPVAVNPPPPRSDVQALPRTAPALNSPQQQPVTLRKQSAMAATTIVPQSEPTGAPGDMGTAAAPVTSSPDRNTEPRVPAPALNLTVPSAKLPPRTALQNSIEQQAIRPDAMSRSFERVLEQTAPVTTEITQMVDASGNATVKVRTPGGTYCLKNSTPAGATLYELKTLAGNCPK